jgi:hypothetical protein
VLTSTKIDKVCKGGEPDTARDMIQRDCEACNRKYCRSKASDGSSWKFHFGSTPAYAETVSPDDGKYCSREDGGSCGKKCRDSYRNCIGDKCDSQPTDRKKEDCEINCLRGCDGCVKKCLPSV